MRKPYIVVVALVLGVLTTPEARGQSPQPKLVSSAKVDVTSLEVDNVDNQLLVGIKGRSGVWGADLQQELAPQFSLHQIHPGTTNPPFEVFSTWRGHFVAEERGFDMYYRAGQALSYDHNGVYGMVPSNIRTLGTDAVVLKFGDTNLCPMQIWPILGGEADSSGITCFSFWYDQDGIPVYPEIWALETLESTVYMSLEGIMTVVYVTDDLEEAKIMKGFYHNGFVIPPGGIKIIEHIGDGMLWASTGTETFVASTKAMKWVGSLGRSNDPVLGIRSNGRLVAVTTEKVVTVLTVGDNGEHATDPKVVAQIHGAGFTAAELNRSGLLVTASTENGLQVWDIWWHAYMATPEPTRMPLPQVVSKLWLPYVSQPEYRMDIDRKPFVRDFQVESIELP